MTQHATLEIPAGSGDAELINDDITHCLGHSWFFDPQTIGVAVHKGRVKLTGSVRSERERRMAVAAAWAHEGVVQVDNQLVLLSCERDGRYEKKRLGGRLRPRFSRRVVPSYSVRNRPRRCSSGTTWSTKSSRPAGR